LTYLCGCSRATPFLNKLIVLSSFAQSSFSTIHNLAKYNHLMKYRLQKISIYSFHNNSFNTGYSHPEIIIFFQIFMLIHQIICLSKAYFTLYNSSKWKLMCQLLRIGPTLKRLKVFFIVNFTRYLDNGDISHFNFANNTLFCWLRVVVVFQILSFLHRIFKIKFIKGYR